MKVYTITTSYANNYGALLQTYALSRFLNNQEGIECEVIQYYRDNYNDSWTLLRKPSSVREAIKTVYSILNIPLLRANKTKNKVMRKFMRENIPYTQTAYYTVDSIYNEPPKGDAFICGSDQIWNMKYMFHGKLVFFLDFVPEGQKRISYAASIADPWQPEHIKMLEPVLKKFSAISIREKGNLEQVRSIFPQAEVTIDPVFLLDKKHWAEFASTDKCPDEPYILCYFLSVTDLAVKTVQKLRELTGLKVVHLNLNALDKFHSDYNVRVASPHDFVGLISNATLICTNSFHCSAFSIINKKDFVFVPKHMANERVLNLQNRFMLGNVCINEERLSSLQLSDLKIDYTQGEESGTEFIENSKRFLLEALNGKED